MFMDNFTHGVTLVIREGECEVTHCNTMSQTVLKGWGVPRYGTPGVGERP